MRQENVYADLADHLKNSVMSIDIWEGDNEKTQYGTCRIALSYLLRQGKPEKLLVHDFKVYDPYTNHFMGNLGMTLRNKGRISSKGGDGVPNKETYGFSKNVTSA